MSTFGSRRSWFMLAVIAIVLGLLLWPRDRAPSLRSGVGATSATVPSPATLTPTGVSELPALDVVAERGTGQSDPTSRAAAVRQLDETIRLYRETMTFPLWSRPADAANADLTNWNRPISIGQEFAVDADKREIEVNAGIDRVFARPGQAVSVTITVRRRDDRAPVAAEVDAQLQWRDRDAEVWVTAAPVTLQASGAGWSGAIVPSTVEALRAPIREARILAFVRLGEYSRELPLDFAYAVDPPVVVHGLAADRVVNGSLELGLDVELATAAPVRLIATLFAADGTTPIAVYDDRAFPTRPGRQVLAVRYFGKILHDRNVDGPYRLGAIHGYVYRQDLVPDQLFFDRADDPSIVTAAHRAASFSGAGYDGPEVESRLAQYRALRDSLAEGREPPPLPPSPPPGP